MNEAARPPLRPFRVGESMRTMKWALWAEWSIVIVLACVAAGTAYMRASTLDPVVYSYGAENGYRTSDMWFNGDIPKLFTMMTSRSAEQHVVTAQHPLISLIVYSPAFVLRRLGLTTLLAIRVFWALLAALWTALLFILLRLVGCRPFDAAIFTLLGITSAASVFWFAVPEVFSIGSLTIIVALSLTAVAGRARSPLLLYGLVNMLTLSATLTNWMVGIFASILNLPWRRALIAITGGFVVMWLLWSVEKMAFPRAAFLLGAPSEASSIFLPTPTRVFETISAFLSHTMVMPAIKVLRMTPLHSIMSVQESIPGSGSPAGYIAAAAWIVLLSLGVWACVSVARRSRLILLICIITVAQLALHSMFGGETFLYSPHFLPLLIIIAACATFTRFRTPGLVLAGILTVSAAINNNWQFVKAVEFIRMMGQLAAAYHK